MLSRSYLIDITLVGFASFTLLCVLARTPSGDSLRQSFTVAIQQADGQKATYRVDQTSQTADQLRADLVQRLTGPRTPNVAWMHWYQETAERYAADCVDSASGPVAQQTGTESVFQTVSQSSRGAEAASDIPRPTGWKPIPRSQSSKGAEAASEQLAGWHAFWTERQSTAATWLASYEKSALSREAALNASIQITPVRSWLPSASVGAKSALVAVLVMLLGSVWRLVRPPRSCRPGSLAPAGAIAIAARGDTGNGGAPGGQVAAMCFRESWVRVRQPASVVSRSVCGWAIVLASFATGVWVFIDLLVS